jgi:pentachlorophenol monooxygenase
MNNTDVLIAGAGPVGLTAAIEMTRRGISCRIVDPLPEAARYAKAVGLQPRTLEIFEGMGMLRQILDASVPLRGQLVCINGKMVAQFTQPLPADVPFGFIAIPQYETERVLGEELAMRGVRVERGLRLAAFEQGADGVTATLSGDIGDSRVRCRYLVGADGAHSVVRKTLGLSFEGGAFDEQYMLGDVEVNWSLPHDKALRFMHQTDGQTDDVLVCVPLPGHGRYRMSMRVADDLATARGGAADGVAHGFEGSRQPELHHIQAVLDRLSPQPVVARNLRWSSVFRISHRIVNAYSRGRVFLAGDAAHIHPPTGAQGMNTGIQDAHNLAWKLALAVRGEAAAGLLDSYDAERRPIGEEVVGRTVHSARVGIGADSKDADFVVQREAQLLIDYAGSPIVAEGGEDSGGPQAGSRAPDAGGLTRDSVSAPLRLYSLLGRREHATLLYAGEALAEHAVAELEAMAQALRDAAHGHMEVYLIAAAGIQVAQTVLPLICDTRGDFARLYAAAGLSVFLVRPDGYLGLTMRGRVVRGDLLGHLRTTFAEKLSRPASDGQHS